MKFSLCAFKYYILVLLMLVLLTIGVTTHYSNPKHYMSDRSHKRSSVDNGDISHSIQKEVGREELGRALYPMGSSLPDCSHACGVCAPCKRVMVSFKCASESCPIVYRCMCNGKFYHVPSSN